MKKGIIVIFACALLLSACEKADNSSKTALRTTKSNTKTTIASTTKKITNKKTTTSQATTSQNLKYTNEYYSRDNDKIYFGYYPQTEEKDEDTIAYLNSLAGTLPTKYESYKWTDYGYYFLDNSEDVIEDNYMWYIDIDLDDDDCFDYRGVYYRTNRSVEFIHPIYTDAQGERYQAMPYEVTGSSYYPTKKVYWFKYEAIEWNILEEKDGKALIISDQILDCQPFFIPSIEMYNSYKNQNISLHKTYLNETIHNGGYGYSNNYELSSIRMWLNDDFYNLAFNDIEKKIVETTIVDNSAKSTGIEDTIYACNDTNDKVFLLSVEEVIKYYFSDVQPIIGVDGSFLYDMNSDDERAAWSLAKKSSEGGNIDFDEAVRYLPNRRALAKGTNYSQVQGLKHGWDPENKDYYTWILRSPSDGIAERRVVEVCESLHFGPVHTQYGNPFYETYDSGTRPAMWITL